MNWEGEAVAEVEIPNPVEATPPLVVVAVAKVLLLQYVMEDGRGVGAEDGTGVIDLAGQLVTEGAHEVTVTMLVWTTVVASWTEKGAETEDDDEDETAVVLVTGAEEVEVEEEVKTTVEDEEEEMEEIEVEDVLEEELEEETTSLEIPNWVLYW